MTMTASIMLAITVLSRTVAVTNAAALIDAAIAAKGGVTPGGLLHAAEGIASIPAGGDAVVTWYYGWTDEVVDTRRWTTNDVTVGTLCEYLESHNSEYIDLGVTADLSSTWAYVDLWPSGSNTERDIFGDRTSRKFGMHIYSNQYSFPYGSGWNDYKGVIGQRSVIELRANEAYIDGALKATFAKETAATARNLYLFTQDNNGSPYGSGFTGRIYEFRLGTSSGWGMDLLPMVDTNGVPCMVDSVTCVDYGPPPTVYYNRGGGAFAAGSSTNVLSYKVVTVTGSIVTNVVGYLYSVTNSAYSAAPLKALAVELYDTIEGVVE